jgi:hypothetical protein
MSGVFFKLLAPKVNQCCLQYAHTSIPPHARGEGREMIITSQHFQLLVLLKMVAHSSPAGTSE